MARKTLAVYWTLTRARVHKPGGKVVADAASIYEKLGVFYLGRDYDVRSRELREDLTLYDSKDLVTHAMIVGMTGSGKTGLGVGLLEEAAIDNVPAIVVDPKGDLTNLLLQFPDLRPEDFKPWVHADDAQRADQTIDEFAQSQSELWKKGLADWGQDGERIRRLKHAADVAIYTPGSNAGIPVSILASFSAPPAAVVDDADLFRDRISTVATSLLALLNIDADPIKSREHILLTMIMPPVAEPPSKKPLLTLLKQARAFGLGVVLATQNPVDLDYKGLSNTGTWFLGRLQTEQDKDRVLDGLEGASTEAGAEFDRSEISDILSGLGKRIFLLHNVHDAVPITFQTRWVLSYLAGPMTRIQIKKLMADKKPVAETFETQDAATATTASCDTATEPAALPAKRSAQRPVLASSIPQTFLPARRAVRADELIYRPFLLALTKVHFVNTRKGLSANEERLLLASLDFGAMGLDWDQAEVLDMVADDLEKDPQDGADFADLPAQASSSKSYTSWKKSLSYYLYHTRRYHLFRSPELKEFSKPGESERDFRIRLADEAREKRDEQVNKLRKKYSTKLRSASERIRKAERRLDREKQEASNAKMQSMVVMGATLLGGLLGRKMISHTNVRRGASAMRGVGRANKQSGDVSRAAEDVFAYEDELRKLEEELQVEIDEISESLDPLNIELDNIQLKPRRTDIDIRHLGVAWVPFRRSSDGILTAAYK